MKVCTDATLFGAMAPIKGGEQVLDIGTGTGVLALMAAQLGAAHVTAVDICEDASSEAEVNFNNSPWAEQLVSVQADIQSFAQTSTKRFDLVISNPPFFLDHTRSADEKRNLARHAEPLPFEELIVAAERVLRPKGAFYLLIPLHAVETILTLTRSAGLHLIRKIDIRAYHHKPPKLTALLFTRSPSPLVEKVVTLYQQEKVYTEESERLLTHFLLRFADSLS